MKKVFLKVFSAVALSLITFSSLAACNSVSSLVSSQSSNSENTETSAASGETLIKLSGSTGVAVGKTTALKTTVYGPNSSVTFSSSDENIATVDKEGVVTGIKPGFVTITAKSVLSTSSDPITSSFTLFVEPAYVVTMINAFSSYDYASGVYLSGDINLSPSNSALPMSYTLALQNKKDTSSSVDSYYSDFALVPPSDLSSLLYSSLQSGFTGKSIDFAYLGGSTVDCYSVSSENSTVGYYKELSPLSSLASLVSPTLISTLVGSKTVDSTDAEDNAALLGEACNSFLAFDTDASKGISLNSTALALLNNQISSFKTSAKSITDFSSKDNLLKIVLAALLPSDISDFRFLVETNSDGSFKDLRLKVTDMLSSTDSSSSSEATPYTYLDLTVKKDATALSDNYFSTLSSTLATAKTESASVTKICTSATSLMNTLNDFNGSTYDALNYSSSFADDVAAYNSDIYPLISKVTNTALFPSQTSDYVTMEYTFGPYEKYAVTFANDANKNVITDNYKPSVNDVFSLGTVTPAGNADSKTMAFETAPTFALSISDEKAASDYATLDGNTLTITKLPTDADLTLTVTPSGY